MAMITVKLQPNLEGCAAIRYPYYVSVLNCRLNSKLKNQRTLIEKLYRILKAVRERNLKSSTSKTANLESLKDGAL